MAAIYQPANIQPLVERFGAKEVHQAWLTVHGWPATWMPSDSNVVDVWNYLEAKEKGQ